MTIHWSAPTWIWPLLLVMAAGAVIWTVGAYRATRPAPAARLRRLLMVLRGSAFVLLVLGIAAPVVSRLADNRDSARVLMIVEDSASMAVADETAGRSRWQRAGEIVAAVDSLAGALGPGAVATVLAGNGLETLHPFAATAEPEARGTDLNALADEALRRAVGQPVRAVILLSDGQETRSAGPPRRAGSGPAVFVVGVGDPEGPADRVIRDLRYPDSVHRGDEIVVELLVDHRHADGSAGSDLRVTLSGSAGVLADTLLGAVTGAVPVQLTIPAVAEGLLVADLTVSALPNERFLANNTASLAVDVRRQRSQVLLLTERPGWDVRFLAQAATAESRLALTVVYPTAAGLVRADSLTAWTAPRGAEAWGAWDAFVVTGWRGGLAGLDWAGLAAAIRAGRGLFVLPGAGPDLPGAPGPPPEPLQDLLPCADVDWFWRRGNWRVAAAPAADRHALLANVTAGIGQWPPVRDLLTTRNAAAGVTLLGARPEGAAPDSLGQPLLVVGRADAGRIVWYGARRLWELAFAEVVRAGDGAADGEGAGRRLLRNLLAWITAGDTESGLVFAGRQIIPPEGDPIRLTAHWRDIRGLPVTDRRAVVVVRRTDADSTRVPDQTQTLRPVGGGVLEATLPPLPPGSYQATLQEQGAPDVVGATLPFVVAGQSVEAGQVRRDQRRLDLLARALDATVISGSGSGLPPDLQTALAGLDWSPEVSVRRHRVDLWSGWPYLTLVTGLLAVEWFLRRRHGLL